MSELKADPTYLGDGVYARDEGYTIALSVNDHRNEPVVDLEPSVLAALITYAEHCKQIRKSDS